MSSICKPEEKEAYKEEWRRWANKVVTPLSCDVWQRLQAWDFVYATLCLLGCLCTVTSLTLQHHILKSWRGFLRQAVTDTQGATLTPMRWAAAEDHGPAVAAQAPQRLPAPVDLRQSNCCRSLPPFLLPGCSNAAPARPATLLPPRVGGERATTSSAHRRERGETDREESVCEGKMVKAGKSTRNFWLVCSLKIQKKLEWICKTVSYLLVFDKLPNQC